MAIASLVAVYRALELACVVLLLPAPARLGTAVRHCALVVEARLRMPNRASMLTSTPNGSAAGQAIRTTICDITRSPGMFDGKMVRVRATITSGFEVFAIRDPNDQECASIWLSYPGAGPAAYTSIKPTTESVQRQSVKLKNHRALKRFQQFLNARMYPRSRGSICHGCSRYEVTATLQGRIDYAGKGLGFGHLNGYETQLVLEGVSDVNATDQRSRYDPNEFSPRPVRFPTGYLKGLVVAPDGHPVTNAQVTAISTGDVPLYMHDFTEWSDKAGRFKIAVPPGTYVVGVNLETSPSAAAPFPPTYYPGATGLNGAKKLLIADRREITGLAIHLPQRLRERSIPVKVTRPDGSPVEGANVWLSEVTNPTTVVGTAVSHTNKEGIADLVGLESIDYFVHCGIYPDPGYTPYCADKRTVKAGDPVTDRLILMLTRSGNPCKNQ